MRRNPRINGPAALPLFCLAPHGVFPASRIAARAVSSYLAFSTLPGEQLALLVRRYIFCDTFRRRTVADAPPACSTRHVAVWCSDFPLARRCRPASDHLPSDPRYLNGESRKRNLEAMKPERESLIRPPMLLLSGFLVFKFNPSSGPR